MKPTKSTAQHLAVLLSAAGCLNSVQAAFAASGDRWQSTLKAVDRSPLVLASGKTMTCGRCATQGMCGESYLDKLRKQDKSAAAVRSSAAKKKRPKHAS
jgi:hypothetical protein